MDTFRRPLLALALLVGAAACSGEDAPEALASADPVESEADGSLAESSTSTATPTTAAPTTTSAAAPTTTTSTTTTTTTAAPTTTTSTTTTTTTAAPTTTTSSTTTTTIVPGACAKPRYSTVVPTNWFDDDCTRFSEGPFPAPGAPIEFRPEIDLAVATTETFAQAVARIQADLNVLSSQPTTVDGLSGERFIIEEEWFEIGERTLVVIDLGDAVFFASANELVDINAPTQMTLADRYAQTLTIFDSLLANTTLVSGQ